MTTNYLHEARKISVSALPRTHLHNLATLFEELQTVEKKRKESKIVDGAGVDNREETRRLSKKSSFERSCTECEMQDVTVFDYDLHEDLRCKQINRGS